MKRVRRKRADPFGFLDIYLVVDLKGNLTYYLEGDRWEKWEHDEEGRVIYYENSSGYKLWKEYSDAGKLKKIRDNRGLEKIIR